MADIRDSKRSSPSREPKATDDDEDDVLDGNERDQMIPKATSSPLHSYVATAPSLRSRLFRILIGLVVCVIVALSISFYMQDSSFGLPSFPEIPHSFKSPKPKPLSRTSPTSNPNPIPDATIRKAIVVASYKGQHVGWMENIPKYTRGWEIFRYMINDPKTTLFHSVPSQWGREAMIYLTFIIDNYDTLPDFTVFLHGHDQAWHQPEHTIDKLMALNLTAVADEGYVNLRCSMSPGCTKDSKFYFKPRNKKDNRPGMAVADGFWKHQLQHEFGPLPPVFGRRCCAQFAVTRDAIQLRSLAFWKSLRKPLEGTMRDMKKIWGPNIDQYRLGSLFEQVWHVLFGKPADYCPDKTVCEKVHFADILHCDGETVSFKANAGNWRKITCTNPLRSAIDSGEPLESVVPYEMEPLPLPPRLR